MYTKHIVTNSQKAIIEPYQYRRVPFTGCSHDGISEHYTN